MIVTVTHKQILLIVPVLALYSQLSAQEYKYEIGGMAGSSFYMGDLNKSTLFKAMNPAVGGVFRYNPNFRWAVKTGIIWGRISGTTQGMENTLPENTAAVFNRDLIEAGGQMEFNFFPYSDKFAYLNARRLTPYILLGLGLTAATGNSGTFIGLNIPVGAGVKYKVRNRINLGCEFTMRKLFRDDMDVTNESNAILGNPYGIASSRWKNQDWYSFLLISVTWDFGLRCGICNNRSLSD